MHLPRHLSFLLLNTFFCYVASLSVSEPLTLTSNITQSPNAQPSCTGFKIFKLRPLYRDCDRAISALSSSLIPGNFHTGRPGDDWELPDTYIAGTCEIDLRLAPLSLPEPSSWMEVKAAVTKLNDDCRVKSTLGDVTGGRFTAGPHDRIFIQLLRINPGVEEVAGG